MAAGHLHKSFYPSDTTRLFRETIRILHVVLLFPVASERSEISFFLLEIKQVTQAQQLIRFCSLHTLRSILDSSVFIKYFSFDPNWVASWIFNNPKLIFV